MSILGFYLGKLEAWQEGRSAKHPADIREMLIFILSGLSDEDLDLDYISARAARLGTEVLELWQALLNQAKAEIRESTEGGIEGGELMVCPHGPGSTVRLWS